MTLPSRRPVRVLISAIGGYGHYYLQTLLEKVAPDRATLAGVVDPQARQARAWPWVESRGVPVFDDMEGFYSAGHEADLAVIVSPIQFHVPQSCTALEHGSHVLCDKPLGATVQEAARLIAARDRAGRFVMIGYQWSYSTAIQALKGDILAGLFGRPVRFSTLCCWPRHLAYYQRNPWAGRLRDPDTGQWVLDGPANNAMAHFLHNLLYLGGPRTDRSAAPRTVQAECYRAYPIESCDTAVCRVIADDGLEVLLYASHVTEAPIDPRFTLEFESAAVTFDARGGGIVARGQSGTEKRYGAPDDSPQFKKLFDAIDASHAIDRSHAPATVVCGPEAAMAQTLALNGVHESVGDPASFPDSMVAADHEAERRYVPGLAGTLSRCYDRRQLPAESGIGWARGGARVNLDGYLRFPRAESATEDRRSG
jgi:predicted dehydrogenase